MKSNKGISMIALVITIIVMIILIGIATTAGYKYIIEGNKIKAQAVASVISEAAYRRQNDLASGVAVRYYEGYSFDVTTNATTKYKNITGLPEGDIDNNSIPDCLEEDGAKWYLFDADSANALGVQEANRFITQNISYPSALKEEEVKLVLADYSTGKGYLVDMPKDTIEDSIRQNAGCLNSPTGNHNYKIMATCTTPASCMYCGEADPLNPALGHNYTAPTCTASGACTRCKLPDPDNGPLGHLMISNADTKDSALIAKMNARECRMYTNGPADSTTTPAWIADALKHWHECIRCGEKSEETEHKSEYISEDDYYHYNLCYDCGWQSIKTKHVCVYTSLSGDTTHKVECTVCEYEDEHNDSGWKADHKDYHYRLCEEADCYTDTLLINGVSTNVLFKEEHIDVKPEFLYCDICDRCLDNNPPESFGSREEYYGKLISATTNSLVVEAFTEDKETGVDFYQFGIYNPDTNEIEWGEKSVDGKYEFEGLEPNTEYTVYVKATDKAGNVTPPYKIPGTKTGVFPEFNGLTNVPDTFEKGPVKVGIAEVITEMKDLIVEYCSDGTNWKSVKITELDSVEIDIYEEKQKVQLRFFDGKNRSPIKEYEVDVIDSTPPTVVIEKKSGDKIDELSRYHTAKVTISDEKVGIAPETEIRYAWSTSNTEIPTEFITVKTNNLSAAESVEIEIITPEGVKGNYYLWIDKGVKDSVGNETVKPEKSSFAFVLDDEEVKVSNIKMSNLMPEVVNEYYFVKENGYVTVSFEVDKKLGQNPVVKINEKLVTMETSDGLKYVGRIQITNSFEEGELQLNISNIVSETGRINKEIYTNEDLVEGPVYFDYTIPVLEYISKQ